MLFCKCALARIWIFAAIAISFGANTKTLLAATMAAGVNLSGLEMDPGALPGTVYQNYVVPSQAELAYYHSKGVNLVRLPIEWERLQPSLTRGHPDLDPAYLGYIETVITEAGQLGMRVILDVHNNGQFDQNWIGGGVVNYGMFGGFWQRVAHHLAGMPGLAGYDLMNEPENMPSAAAWPRAAQTAVDYIRKVDMATPIYVEGDNWANAGAWPQYNENLSINDPADKIIYEAHVYGDRDGSGTHFVWSQEVQYGVTVNTIAERIQPFATWCAAKHVTCMIGETGVGNDDPSWNTELANGLAAASMAGMPSFTYWAGGQWWGGYPLSIEPQNGVDALQMGVVGEYGSP
jgi:aryl-phospho-beta-D-glucosidase BglC (GH1 family)